MADVTSELIYEVLKPIQKNLSNLEEGQRDVKAQLVALRGGQHAIKSQMSAMQVDIGNVYQVIGSLDARVSRIEKRLDIVDTSVL